MNARTFLSIYRKMQYALFGRAHYGVMSPGQECSHEPFEQDINHGDVVHPCVRFIADGYEGHKWWMVYTPYYGSNDKTENPILCYADDNTAVPPRHWRIYCQVQKQPERGYNSDPALLYTNQKLYVFWRENLTKRCLSNSLARATFGGVVRNGAVCDIFGPTVGTIDAEVDPETSPAFIEENDGTYRCLATYITFHSKKVKKLSPTLQKILRPIMLALDLLGVWSQQKAHGMAQWKCGNVDGRYELWRTIKFENQNRLYRPWHIDFFEWQNVLYAIIQSNQCNADICLAESKDRVNFRFFRKPLMTNATCEKVGIYKPTAGVVGEEFFLYYTAQDKDNRALNKLYLTTMNFEKLISMIK